MIDIDYKCANCGKVIHEGEFIAVVGQAPASGLSTPIGRADKLFDNVGRIYGAECFQNIGAEQLVRIAVGGEKKIGQE
jgi:hypothetical protein